MLSNIKKYLKFKFLLHYFGLVMGIRGIVELIATQDSFWLLFSIIGGIMSWVGWHLIKKEEIK